MSKSIHNGPNGWAGQTVKIKDVPSAGELAGQEYRVEDWWDRASGQSWMWSKGNPACIVYALRSGLNGLPTDDEVLYGKVGPFGHLVHVSEIEGLT